MTTNKNILLIIANGPSALKEKLGDRIDQFNAIGRINNYTTNNFEKFIGSKTNIWFNGANQRLKIRQRIRRGKIIGSIRNIKRISIIRRRKIIGIKSKKPNV